MLRARFSELSEIILTNKTKRVDEHLNAGQLVFFINLGVKRLLHIFHEL